MPTTPSSGVGVRWARASSACSNRATASALAERRAPAAGAPQPLDRVLPEPAAEGVRAEVADALVEALGVEALAERVNTRACMARRLSTGSPW